MLKYITALLILISANCLGQIQSGSSTSPAPKGTVDTTPQETPKDTGSKKRTSGKLFHWGRIQREKNHQDSLAFVHRRDSINAVCLALALTKNSKRLQPWKNKYCKLQDAYFYNLKLTPDLPRDFNFAYKKIYEVTDSVAMNAPGDTATHAPDTIAAYMHMRMAVTTMYFFNKHTTDHIIQDTARENIQWYYRLKNGVVTDSQINGSPNGKYFRVIAHSKTNIIDTLDGMGIHDTVTMHDVTDLEIGLRRDFRHIKNDVYINSDKVSLCLGASGTPMQTGWAHRAIRISAPQIVDTILKKKNARQAQEHAIAGYAWQFAAGISLNRANVLSISYLRMGQGFATDSFRVDWTTGLQQNNFTDKTTYNFQTEAIGILLQHGGCYHAVNFAADAGLYASWVRKFQLNSDKLTMSDIPGLRAHNLVLNGGVGINVRIRYFWELRIMGQGYLTVNSINTGSFLRDNLITYGASIGLTRHIMLYIPDNKK